MRLFDYNYWSNLRVKESIDRDLPEKCRALELFSHCLTAEKVWQSRMVDSSFETGALFDTYDIAACVTLIETLHKGWVDIIMTRDLQESIVYKNSKGRQFKTPASEILIHVVNHSTYHRGQVAKELVDVGAKPAVTDFIVFSRE